MNARERLLQKLAAKTAAMGGNDIGRFRPKDGKYTFRVLPSASEAKITDGTPTVEVFQHWFKIEGKSKPFFCAAKTAEDHDASKCRACQVYGVLGEMQDNAADEDFREYISDVRKKFSYRSSSVMNIVLRQKDSEDEALLYQAPQTVARKILGVIADAMVEDEEFDPLDPVSGHDFNLTRATEKGNTSYEVQLARKPKPVGEYKGEPVDLDKYYASEAKSATTDRFAEQMSEVITSLLTPVFEMADSLGVDFEMYRERVFLSGSGSKKSGGQGAHKTGSQEKASQEKAQKQTSKPMSQRQVIVPEEDDDDDDALLREAQEAILAARANEEDED